MPAFRALPLECALKQVIDRVVRTTLPCFKYQMQFHCIRTTAAKAVQLRGALNLPAVHLGSVRCRYYANRVSELIARS
jgi:hypothetical protein